MKDKDLSMFTDRDIILELVTRGWTLTDTWQGQLQLTTTGPYRLLSRPLTPTSELESVFPKP